MYLLLKPHDIEADTVRSYWPRAVGALALTGDAKVIPVLTPFLDCRGRLCDGWLFSNPFDFPGRWPEVRVCDSALHAILTLMGEDLRKAYESYGHPTSLPLLTGHATSLPVLTTGPAPSWSEDDHHARVCQVRDQMVADLKKRLDRRRGAD